MKKYITLKMEDKEPSVYLLQKKKIIQIWLVHEHGRKQDSMIEFIKVILIKFNRNLHF
jgi:hypothetical protein